MRPTNKTLVVKINSKKFNSINPLNKLKERSLDMKTSDKKSFLNLFLILQ